MEQRQLPAQPGGQRVERVVAPRDLDELRVRAGGRQGRVQVPSVVRLHDVISSVRGDVADTKVMGEAC